MANSKSLIAYFSRKGKNYVGGNIVDLSVGNTEIVAKKLQELTGSDIFVIQTVRPYPEGYTETTEVAKEELRQKARPELEGRIEGMNSYEQIFVGYPNWWSTIPMPVAAFLSSYDLSGRTILPFCTHEGSGLGRSVEDIRKLCPRSTVREGLAIKGGEVQNSKKEIDEWLRRTSPGLMR